MNTVTPAVRKVKQALAEKLRTEVRAVRAEAFRNNSKSPVGVKAGQFAILIGCIDRGSLPSRKALRQFFGYVAGERLGEARL